MALKAQWTSEREREREREATGTWAVESGTLEAFLLDDEAGADESAGNDG